MGLIEEKNEGQKSRETVPLRQFTLLLNPCRDELHGCIPVYSVLPTEAEFTNKSRGPENI
jgi:hypothetical protein